MEPTVSEFSLHMDSKDNRRPYLMPAMVTNSPSAQKNGYGGPNTVSSPVPSSHSQMPRQQLRRFDAAQLASPDERCAGNKRTNQSSQQACEINVLWWPILKHADFNGHRDAVCRYLQLTPELWCALYRPRQPSTAQDHLRQYLSRLYGTLPAGLWECLVKLRNHNRFEQWQDHFVETMTASSSVKSHCPSPSGTSASGYDAGTLGGASGGPALQLGLTSPLAMSPFLSPGLANGIQTPSATPGSVVDRCSREDSRTSDHPTNANAKGRAPAGYHYVCPYTNCCHRPFINTGNYINHMDRCHAEYFKHDPKDSLQPDSSLQRATGDDWISSTATEPISSPLYTSNRFEDLGKAADLLSPASCIVSLSGSGYSGQRYSSEQLDQINPHPASTSAGPTSSSTMEACNLMDSAPEPSPCWSEMNRDDVPEYAPTFDGGLSFGMFKASLMRSYPENGRGSTAVCDRPGRGTVGRREGRR